jgi:hypothetical protein
MASNDDTSWHMRAEIALLAALRAGQAITYEGLATAAEIPAPHRIHKLTLWLEASMAEDVAAGRPLRATIVISRRYDRPAKGFFDMAISLGLIDADTPQETQWQWYQNTAKPCLQHLLRLRIFAPFRMRP